MSHSEYKGLFIIMYKKVYNLCYQHTSVIFVLWALWLSSHSLLLGPYSFTQLHDNAECYLPAKMSIESIQNLYPFSKWNHQWQAGSDISGTTFASDIDTLLFLLFPGWLAYGLFLFIQRFIAGYFFYRFLSDYVDVDRASAICSGLLYSFFSYNSINAQWDGFFLQSGLWLPGLPFILWAFERIRRKDTFFSIIGAIAIGFFIGISSIYVYSMFAFVAIILWLIFINPYELKKSSLLIFICIIAWLISESPFILSGLMNGPFSQRTNRGADHFLLGTNWHVIKLMLKENILQIVSILIATLISRKMNKKNIWLISFSIVFLLFFLFYNFFFNYIQIHFGLFKVIKFNNIYLLFPFFITVVFGISLALIKDMNITDVSGSKKIKVQSLIIFIILASLILQSIANKEIVLRYMMKGHIYTNLFEHPIIKQFSEKNSNDTFRVTTMSGPGTLLPPSSLWAYGIDTVDGTVPLHPMSYKKFWAEIIHPELKDVFMKRRGCELALYSSINNDKSSSDIFNNNMLSLLNVKYIFSTRPLRNISLKSIDFPLNTELERGWNKRFKIRTFEFLTGKYIPYFPIYVYENHNVLPRYFLVGKIKQFNDPEALLQNLKTSSIIDLRENAFVMENDINQTWKKTLNGKSHGSVSLKQQSQDQLILETNSDKSSILIVSQTYTPFWTVYVDDIKQKIFAVDYTLQGVFLTKGKHTVSFVYSPTYY
ncbi:membrane protein [Candidatus Magnetomorum sp. HK-1]|nr:membrane protein [Candidatus Magnetomorum sp. HK-1]